MAEHFVVNDQEHERFRASVEVEEQTLRELYPLPFEALVKEVSIASVMSSYSRIRGVYASEYQHTLTEILRAEWGSDGYVKSDFWSARCCAASLNAGIGPGMPDAEWRNAANVTASVTNTGGWIGTESPGSENASTAISSEVMIRGLCSTRRRWFGQGSKTILPRVRRSASAVYAARTSSRG